MKAKLFILFFTTIVILSGKVKGQINPEWVSTFADSSISLFYTAGIVKDNSDNVYIASGQGQQGSFLVKYNSSGVEQWTRNIKLGIFDLPRGIVMDSFGNVYVGGIRENNTGTYDYTVMKFSPTGDSLWARIYNGLNNFAMDEVEAMTIDDSNFVYVTGYSHGATLSGDIVTIKYNMNGDSIWIARFNSGGFDRGLDLCVDNSGNVFVTGFSQFGASAMTVLLKYNASGVFQWSKNPQIPIDQSDKILTADNSGNFYLGGYKFFASNDFYLVKYNTNGDTLWSRSHDFSGNDKITAVTLDNQQNVIATGETYLAGTHTGTVKYTPDGTFLWSKYLQMEGSNTSAIPGDVKCDANGNVYVGGAGGSFYVVKYSPDGIGMGLGLFSNGISGNNEVSGIVPGTNDVYIGGRMRLQPTGSAYTSIAMKFNDIPTSILSNAQVPNGFKLDQNYPNPFNPSTNISFELPAKQIITLSVYNSLGHEVVQLINGELTEGKHVYRFDGAGLSSGVYFYRLKTSSFSETRRMILIK